METFIDRTVQRAGIRHQGRWYRFDGIESHVGQRVRVEYDPCSPACIGVTLPDGVFLVADEVHP